MKKGLAYEKKAVDYLLKKGYQILERNYRCPYGEIDIVALKDSEIVFVEVKGGVTEDMGHPVERFTKTKFERVLKSAYHYLEKKGFEEHPFRIDLIVVYRGKIRHFQNISLLCE